MSTRTSRPRRRWVASSRRRTSRTRSISSSRTELATSPATTSPWTQAGTSEVPPKEPDSRPGSRRAAAPTVGVHRPEPEVPAVAEHGEDELRPVRAPGGFEVVAREMVPGELRDLAEVLPVRPHHVDAAERVEREELPVGRPHDRTGL